MIDINVFLAILYCFMFVITMIVFCKYEKSIDELRKDAINGMESLPLFKNIVETQRNFLELSRTYHEMFNLLQEQVRLLKDELKKKGNK